MLESCSQRESREEKHKGHFHFTQRIFSQSCSIPAAKENQERRNTTQVISCTHLISRRGFWAWAFHSSARVLQNKELGKRKKVEENAALNQSCWSGYGSVFSILSESDPIRIQGFDDRKLKKKYSRKIFLSFFKILQFTYVKAIWGAFSPAKGALQKIKFINFLHPETTDLFWLADMITYDHVNQQKQCGTKVG